MNIGNALKELRKSKGIRQNWLANEVGISQTYLSQLENNERNNPTLETLERIVKKLDTPLPFLFMLALDEDDIRMEKRSEYNTLKPVFKLIVNGLI